MTLRVDLCRSRLDLRGLAALCAAHAEYEALAFESVDFEERLAAWIAAPEAEVFVWMAREGPQPVAYASATAEFSTLALERGMPRIEWQTPAWNARAARFYERLGARALPKLRFAVAADALHVRKAQRH